MNIDPYWGRIQGVVLVLLGIFVAVTSYASQARDNNVRSCLAEKINALSVASEKRAVLVSEDTAATKKVLLTVPHLKTHAEFAKILDQYRIAVDHIQAERLKHPVPPYPLGTCDK